MKKQIKSSYKVGFLFLLLSSIVLSKTATNGQSQIFGKLVEWISQSWSDIQIFGTLTKWLTMKLQEQ